MTKNEDIERMMRLAPRVKLGEIIEECYTRNEDGCLGVENVYGVSNSKEIIPTKAKVDNAVISKFYVIRPNEFIYNPRTTRMGDKIAIAYNDKGYPILTSFNNGAFRVKDNARTLPQFLYLFFARSEFDRLSRVNSWGSATELFDWSEMQRVVIPLPSIEVQRELVAVYEGLRQTAEQNEALLKPLGDACHAYIVDCKEKYPAVKLGEYIEICDERNKGNRLSASKVQGISTEKKLIETKANLEGVSLQSYKIIKPSDFVYVADTSRRGDKMALALNNTNEDLLVSSIYTVFHSKNKERLLPEYLYLIFVRDEFDRYSRFNSWGSARETFDWSEMERVQIPLPPIEVQQSIVSLYRCAEEAKAIAQEARELMRTICPALIQRAAQGAHA